MADAFSTRSDAVFAPARRLVAVTPNDMNPQPGHLAEIVDTDNGLVGFAIAARPDFETVVPAGAYGMRESVAAALLSVLTAGRAPGT